MAERVEGHFAIAARANVALYEPNPRILQSGAVMHLPSMAARRDSIGTWLDLLNQGLAS
jgi:hypothetical protein